MFEFNAFKLYTGFVDMGLGDVTKVEITYPDIPDKDGYRISQFNEFEECTKKKITTITTTIIIPIIPINFLLIFIFSPLLSLILLIIYI